MYSRAHLLIEREYEKLQEASPWGIEAHPLKEDNIFEWAAKIHGLQDSLWAGGIFRVYIKFNEHFNIQAPEVCFHTIPFHPNVDMITGKPCIDFLDDYSQWDDSYSLSLILLTVQNLLSNPNLKDPVNTQAADMIMHSPHSYRQMVLDCVIASQRVEAGVTPHAELESRVRFATPEEMPKRYEAERTVAPQITKLSFDDYHTTWCGIATSKPKQDTPNPFLEAIKDRPVLQKSHLGLPKQDIEEQISRQIEEHATLMYGRFRTKPTEEEERAAKLAKLNKMKKIYLPPRISPTPYHQDMGVPPPSKQGREEPWEKEVDDLVAWSSKLDSNTLDVV